MNRQSGDGTILGAMIQTFYTSARQGLLSGVVPDLIRYRGLLRDMVWKELRARYRNAMMGFLWAILQPVMMMAILTFVFGYMLRGVVASRGLATERSYAVFLLCGLVPWQFLAVALACGTNSLLESQELIKKVHFPREVVPLAAVANCLVNLVIGFATLLVVMVVLEGFSSIGVCILYTPFIFAIQFFMVVGLALLLSSMNAHYRDVGYFTDVALAFGFYATPVFYPLPTNLHPLLQRLYMLNPMAHLVTAYRTALLDNRTPSLEHLAYPAAVAAAVLLVGAYVFRRNAPTFADYL